MSTILCIDSASERFALAVDRDGVVTAVQADEPQEHSRLLLPAIQRLIGDDTLEAILVVIGPGAYAGIRVGIATAQGLSLAWGVPLFGIGTLEAAAIASGQADITVVHPAGRGEFAAQAVVAGQLVGEPRLTARESPPPKVAGEGAGVAGGIEVSPRERAEAALHERAPRIRAGELEAGAEAFYLREPSITLSRRQRAAS